MASDWNFIITQVLGYLAFVCFQLILFPQIHKNYTRKTTQGLSIAMIYMWQFSAGSTTTYFVWTKQPVSLILQLGSFAVLTIVILAQHLKYTLAKSNLYIAMASLANAVCSLALFALYYIAMDEGEKAGHTWVPVLLGGILPGIVLSVGFFPQYHIIIRDKSTEGVSVYFSMLDLLGSFFSMGAIFLTEVDWVALSHYLLIVFFEAIMVLFCLYIYPTPKNATNSKLVAMKELSVTIDSTSGSACSKDSASPTSPVAAAKTETWDEVPQYPPMPEVAAPFASAPDLAATCSDEDDAERAAASICFQTVPTSEPWVSVPEYPIMPAPLVAYSSTADLMASSDEDGAYV